MPCWDGSHGQSMVDSGSTAPKELQTICKTFAVDGPAQFEAERCTLYLSTLNHLGYLGSAMVQWPVM